MIRIKEMVLIKTRPFAQFLELSLFLDSKPNKEKLDLLLQKDLVNSSLDLILILFSGV